MVAPADQVVNEDVVGPDYDVIHSWWVTDLGGKIRRDPGQGEQTWFKAPVGTYIARCAELCGLQHALMDGRCTSSRARSTTSSSCSAARTRAAPSSATRNGPASARSATARSRRTSARRSAATRCSPTEGHETLLRNGRADAGGRQELDRRADRRARRVHEAVREGRRLRWRSTSSPSAVPRRLAPGRFDVVADDGRPQAHRDPLPRDVAHLLRARRRARAADPHPARDARRDLPDEGLVQPGRHDARHDDDLPRRHADARRASATTSCR